MTWQRMPMETWQNKVAALAEALPDRALADLLAQVELVSHALEADDVSAGRHRGDVAIPGDYAPATLLTLIEGDLIVGGHVSTQELDGNDGRAALVVFGNLRCASLLNDWGSRVIVTGNVLIDSWLYTAREDALVVIGGDLRVPIYVGGEIATEVGGSSIVEHAHGAIRRVAGAGRAGEAANDDWDSLAGLLELDPARLTDGDDLVPLLEDRLYRTGSILP
ncbi:hypothetical protein [Sphingomonas sp. BK235]|uniref:hypothetical protein n=1 Tax=Sphingomonas sp. BK235 TaxID=2512131 RepID=UPI00104A1411|nr:hypothetical protein [Sphingomonas sp. BK235]TCP33183.1 hypothetical protein EV292_106125 [Sphingomonas sp. BK235]